MQKNIVVLSALVAIGASIWLFARTRGPESFATPTRRPPIAELNKAFPADSRKVFEQSDRFILYSIKSMRAPNQTNTFHGYPIIGQSEIKDTKIKADLVAHFYDGMAGDIMAAGCFNPHHAIRAMKGQKTVDLVICFSCSGVEIHYGQQEGRTNVAREPERFYDAVLADAGVPRSKY